MDPEENYDDGDYADTSNGGGNGSDALSQFGNVLAQAGTATLTMLAQAGAANLQRSLQNAGTEDSGIPGTQGRVFTGNNPGNGTLAAVRATGGATIGVSTKLLLAGFVLAVAVIIWEK